MKTIYLPIDIDIDIEYTDEGVFSLLLQFNYDVNVVPHYIVLGRDELESDDPNSIYVETDDQIYGFHTKHINYSIYDNILTFLLLGENVFYWDNSKEINIKLIPLQILHHTSDWGTGLSSRLRLPPVED